MNLLLSDPAFLSVAAGELTDPYFSNVSLLLHGDGTNGSTTIVDSSPSPKTVTAFDNAQISTAQSKFGGASIALDGSGDFLAADSVDLKLSTGAWTIEGWIYLLVTPASYAQIYDSRQNNHGTINGITLYVGSNRTVRLYQSGVDRAYTSTALPLNAWAHVAATYDQSTVRLFIDGQNTGLNWTSSSLALNNTETLIGSEWTRSAGFLNAYIDDLRITKGVARYTSNFTPPTAPFPNA
jgi:hypothetical protein